MIPTSLLVLLAAGAGRSDGAPPEGPESVLVRYDLTGLLPTYDSGSSTETLMASTGSNYGETFRTSLDELYNRADLLLDLRRREHQELVGILERELAPLVLELLVEEPPEQLHQRLGVRAVVELVERRSKGLPVVGAGRRHQRLRRAAGVVRR